MTDYLGALLREYEQRSAPCSTMMSLIMVVYPIISPALDTCLGRARTDGRKGVLIVVAGSLSAMISMGLRDRMVALE